MAKVAFILRDQPAGNPESGETVTVQTAAGATLATPMTDGNGIAVYQQDGSPGPIVANSTVGGRTVRRDGRSLDQLGTWFPNDAPVVWRTLGNGVIPGYSDPATAANDMAVSAGTGLQVNVATGATLIDGHVYRCTSTTPKTISANASGSTRYDRIVVRFTREGQTTEGTCVLAVLEGTPGAGDAPALTRSAATYEVSLAKVRVVNGAASLTSGDITDERYAPTLYQSYVPTNPNAFSGSTNSLQAGDILYVGSAGKLIPLRKGTDGQILKLASGLPAWVTQAFTVVVQEGDVTVEAEANTLDFDASDFNVTSTPAGEANISLAYGTSAGTPAEGNHTHTNPGVAVKASSVAVGSGITTLDFATGFLVTETPTGEANVFVDTTNAIAIKDHTHTLTEPPTGFATKSYGFTSVTSTAADGVEIAGFDIDIPTGGCKLIAHADAQVNAPTSGGSYIEIGIKLGSQSTDWGMRNQTASGERPCSATSTRLYTTGASAQRVSLRARVDGGSGGGVNAAHINALGVARHVPAS